MKNTIILTIIAVANFAFAFGQNKLIVTANSCKNDTIMGRDYHLSFSVYKGDSLVKETGGKTFLLENLPGGSYQVRYQTLYGSATSEYFELNPNDTLIPYFYDFCVDVPPSSKVDAAKAGGLFFDRMAEGDEVHITYNYYGCFTAGQKQVAVVKKKGKYYMTYNGKRRRVKRRKEVLLKDFEIALRCLELPTGCYSTANCDTNIIYHGENVSVFESCTNWLGFHDLMVALKLEPPYPGE